MFFQIAIDGPSGVGKSTVANLLAKNLSFLHINTGLIFRGIAWYLLRNPSREVGEVLREISQYKIFYFHKNRWILNGKEILEEEFKKESVTKEASKIAKKGEIRRFVLEVEREVARKENIVMEGRDIGTKVFPHAILKVFLNASPNIRAKRRFLELQEKGLLNRRTLEEIEREIKQRDLEDMNRELDPLCKAEDAMEICSDGLTPEEVADSIKKEFEIRKKRLLPPV
ncbi:cytidylate kinase [Mycoplasma haemocanis str. Illinois]|uniref:Cytidylate kinase n=1 Tax=Mycoplasma haemocanis (strain Illinois) TaxID=1111676 RepID=H6N5G1_MYCHN|nr:(d)CMP kinase [Mycoplasma haemocanis]AEW44921.2 cytidylate kinase [Mycoplasma haemocanis str. Illinois]